MALLGRYEYVRELGRGSLGRVIGCRDAAEGGRQVALKAVAPAHTAGLCWEFERLGAVRAPQLVEAFDLLVLREAAPAPFAIEAGSAVLVESWVHGADAWAAAAMRRADPHTLLPFVYGLARDAGLALAALHRAGLVHRDVKPDHLVVQDDGTTVLVDLELCVPPGQVDAVSGTPMYLAPEAFAGVVSPGLDVYALGCSLFDLLAGEGAAAGSARQSTRVPWCERDPAALPSFVPAPLRAWLARLIGTSATDRPLDGPGFLAELDALAEVFGVAAPGLLRWASGAEPDVAVRALQPGWVGQAAARANLLRQLDAGGLVAVTGRPGSGRSRLVREAVRDLQLKRARLGARVPHYVPERVEAVSAAALTDGVIHVRATDAAQWQWASEACRAAEIDGAYLCVVLEADEVVDASVASVRAEPLAREEVGQLLSDVLARAPEDATVDAALEASQGLVGRLCRSLQRGAEAGRDMGAPEAWSPGHRGVEAGVPLPELDGPQQVWLHALCLWDAPVEPFRLGSPQLSEAQALRLARALRDRAWLQREPSGDHVRLTSAAARSLRASLAPAQRLSAAHAAREAFGDRAGSSPWLAEPEMAVDALLSRARGLCQRGSLVASQALLREGRERWRSARVDVALAEVLRAGGGYLEARRVLEPVASAEAGWHWGELARLSGEPEAAERAWGPLVEAGGALASRAAASLARLAVDRGDLAGAEAWLARSEAFDAEDDAEARLRQLEARVRCATGVRAVELADALWELTRAESSPRWQGRALSLRAALRPRGDERAAQEWVAAQRLASEVGEAHEAASYAVNLGLARLDAGDLAPAVERLREGARGFAALDRPQELGRVLFNWANAWLMLGERALAEQVVGRAERESTRVGDRVALASCAVLRAEIATRAGFPVDASRVLAEALAQAPEGVRPLLAARLAFVLSSIERVDEAQQVLDAHAAVEHSYGLEVTLAQVRVALAAGVAPRAEALVVPLLATLRHAGSFEERVRAWLLGAEVARALGNVESAGERLGQCRALLDRAMRGLTPGQQARLRAVDHYARALEASPPEAGLPAVGDEQRWRRLLGAVPRLFRAQDPEAVGQVLCEVALELVAAERALWIVESEAAQHHVRAWAPPERSARETHSASIVEQAWAGGETVSAVDAVRDARWDSAYSVRALSVRSVVAVPMRTEGARAGLYLDDRMRPAAFAEDDVRCLQELARAAEGALLVAQQRRRERQARLEAERREQWLSRRLEAGPSPDAPSIVGQSDLLRSCLRLADRVAQSDLPALIHGESGTGKELVARRICAHSPRAQAAFVAENCAALPENLLESVLFGHVRGAFTGASRDHRGLFEQADGGTLFLDEVGEMSPGMQVKLLRVLETGEVRPVGGSQSHHVDVRLVAATHRDLVAEVRAGRFREDLYYRIAVVELVVPPLRARPEDIAPLVQHFIEVHAPGRTLNVTPQALALWQGAPWRGNVRELENAVRRAIVLADGVIDVAHVRTEEPAAASDDVHPLDLKSQVDGLQRRLIARALAETGGNQTHAAELLGVSRYGLQKMLKRLKPGC